MAGQNGHQNSAISIHALREEGDTGSTAQDTTSTGDFYPRPPRGGRPELPKLSSDWIKISIHALREEGDRRSMLPSKMLCNFYPRPPRGGRPAPATTL